MIVMHGEALWSPAPQPMDDDDDQLNWSILKILTFEPLYDPLMTFYNIVYVLLWLECHTSGVTRIFLVKFELNWSIWKILTFEPL